MAIFTFMSVVALLIQLGLMAALVYIAYLVIRALRKYIFAPSIKKEDEEKIKTLGERIKQQRIKCKMTQELVAEKLGVSRQAVSKWEVGKSEPSTTNLLALAKLFEVAPEELLKELQ